MKELINWMCYGIAIGAIIGIAWGYGVAHGKQYWERQYAWINDELRTDIQNCRTTLNQCKIDLADPHHCVSVCAEEFEKYGC